jgi:hypothetical protein
LVGFEVQYNEYSDLIEKIDFMMIEF